jgi:hypothetical protein
MRADTILLVLTIGAAAALVGIPVFVAWTLDIFRSIDATAHEFEDGTPPESLDPNNTHRHVAQSLPSHKRNMSGNRE